MEAAAAGVPTIAPAVGGIPETIGDEETGLLYRFRDVGDLERQMRRVVEDPDLVPRLIRNLRKPPSITEMSSAVEAFYLDAVAGCRRAE
jgi:glycosyltransferase involved in cell wall biosynthesis